jgi:chlorite dismutase
VAVLIPIAKSESWWAMAQDERLALMKRTAQHEGHMEIGARFAGKILRRLFHARYMPGSEWDFLTYFEFDAAESDDFRRLLEALRSPRQNPEWGHVVRETEIWMRKAGG